jgi:uncharacterized protein (DUF2252 family)
VISRVETSPQERYELGRARRTVCPRSTLGELVSGPARPDPLSLLSSQDHSRISELIPIRYGRMLASPFAFYRGAAVVMVADLAAGPNSGLVAQLCGDAHVANFGLFGSPERNLVFDINDFDETLPGPWEWDVKRLVASLAIAARGNGIRRTDSRSLVCSCARAYRERMRELAALGELDVWYSHTSVDATTEGSVDPRFADAIRRAAAKARTRDNIQASSKLTKVVDGRPRLISDPPLLIPIEELVGKDEARRHEAHMGELFEAYRASLDRSRAALMGRYDYEGMARKVVGVGSVGNRAWVVLLMGRDESDPLLMQVKEAGPSVLEAYLGPSDRANAAERVVEGQRFMQASSDALLGWLHCIGPDGHEGDYYVRQLRDWKGTISAEAMSPALLSDYGQSCAHALARAHARTGDRIAIAGYLGGGEVADNAFTRFAEQYADQNERDFAALREAVADQRVAVETDL